MTTRGYRLSWDWEDDESLLDPERTTASWQAGDERPGLSVCRSVIGLLRWAESHAAGFDNVVLVVVEGEELGEDMDQVEHSVDAVRIRATRVLEIAPLTIHDIMRIAAEYDGQDHAWGRAAIAEAIEKLGNQETEGN